MKPEEAPSCREQGTPLLEFGSQPPAGSVCSGCGSGIRERFLLRVGGRSWHERCLRCSACARPLAGSCFSRERRLYCRRDYDKLFPRRCSSCLEAVGRSEPIQRVLERIFHERCFQCGACERRLRRGDEFVLRGERLLCRGHFQRERQTLGSGSPEPSESARSEDEEGAQSQSQSQSRPRCRGNAEDGKDPKRSKRPRTILSSRQRRAFRASFEVSSKPCRKVRETLAAETGLTVRVVQVWFQNQRAKMKKIARRQQQQQEQLGNSRLGNAGAARSGRDSNEESEAAAAAGAPGLEGLPVPHSRIPAPPLPPPELNGFGTEPGMFRPGMTPPELQPYDSEGVFQEPPGAALGALLIPAENSQALPVPALLGSPMDRLRSMHSSYFTA